MNSPRLPQLHDLHPAKIQELIDDLHLRQTGTRLHYAIDTSEVFDFCFPINPTELRSHDINAIAEDQASLYEVFYVRPDRPVLLLDYAFELQRIHEFLKRTINHEFSKAAMVKELILEGGLGGLTSGFSDGENHVYNEELENIVRDDFNVILAIVMGIFSLGVDRFTDVMHRMNSTPLENINPVVKTILDGYEEPTEESPLIKLILRELSTRHKEAAAETTESGRKYNPDLTDAFAINRLLYLNTALEQAFKEGKLPERHLFIYFSSAPKTQKIFELQAVKERLPVIDGNQYSFWRTRAQLFAYLINKSTDEDRQKRLEETIGNLSEVKLVLEEVQKVGQEFDRCSKCVLDFGLGENCSLAGFCHNVKKLDERIQKRKTEIYNYGLIKTIESYHDLLKAQSKDKSQRAYVNIFKSVYYNSGIKNIATERMRQLQQITLSQSEFSNFVLPDVVSFTKEAKPAHLREDRDVITGTAQYLPTKPKIKDEKYQEIVRKILSYYKTPPQGDKDKDFEIREAYKLYMDIDSQVNEFDPEHELVRCLLYLASLDKEGDHLAYKNLEELLGRPDVNEIDQDILKECRYVLCWAARRIKKFKQVDLWARIATQSYRDGRFYHGWCLNTYAWLSDKEQGKECPYTISDVIKQAREALALYLEDEDEYRQEIGAIYNSLATLWAEYAENVSCDEEAVAEARGALENLKVYVPRTSWSPDHPEYFHTEAYVELQEYGLWNKQRRNPGELISKLTNAETILDIAINLLDELPRERDDYIDLMRKIKKPLKHLKDRQQFTGA
jgi:hypothetical protein